MMDEIQFAMYKAHKRACILASLVRYKETPKVINGVNIDISDKTVTMLTEKYNSLESGDYILDSNGAEVVLNANLKPLIDMILVKRKAVDKYAKTLLDTLNSVTTIVSADACVFNYTDSTIGYNPMVSSVTYSSFDLTGASVYDVTHSKSKFPQVDVLVGGKISYPEVMHVNLNQIRLTFNTVTNCTAIIQ